MPAITVKNIPDSIYLQLKASAEMNRRSINSELIACLEKVLVPQKLKPDQHLANARKLRDRFNGFLVAEEELNEAKGNGRP